MRLEVPLFISEFGACMDTQECEREIMQLADASDDVLSGWAYWSFKTFKDPTTSAGANSEGFYNNDGTVQRKVKQLARTYVRSA